MLSSKQLMEQAGISRATLNNYIALGILPKPEVRRPDTTDRAPQLGYFPEEALDRIDDVRRLKKEGLSMGEIAARLRGLSGEEPEAPERDEGAAPRREAAPAEPAVLRTDSARSASVDHAGFSMSLAELDVPAYLLNYNFEVEWANKVAEEGVFGLTEGLHWEIGARNFFKLFLNSPLVSIQDSGWRQVLAFHLAIAKTRMSRTALGRIASDVSGPIFGALTELFDHVSPAQERTMLHDRVRLGDEDTGTWLNLYATFFREGVLIIQAPGKTPAEDLLDLLSRRDALIRDLLKNRTPVLTPVCVLVADLQESMRLCAELPPEEYFELINQVWRTLEPIFRKHHGTQGKHAGDGVVAYFFPQPDSEYILNAINCADEIRRRMHEISKEWQLRKGWFTELYLNIGLNEGQEWFGTYHAGMQLELVVLGDTVNHAARLSDHSRFGGIWATKQMMEKLPSDTRRRFVYGVKRETGEGREIFVPRTYAPISSLVDLGTERTGKLRDIATLAVTEIVEMSPEHAPKAVEPDGDPRLSWLRKN